MMGGQTVTSGDLLKGLKGQRVLITAGGAGIGYAIAQTLRAQGARIAVCDISKDAMARVERELPDVEAMIADVSRDADVDRIFDIIANKFGGLDALVNNAGIAGPTGGVEEIDPDEWRRCLDICLTGQFLCTRRVVPFLKQAGGGSIVNISSDAGRRGSIGQINYAAAKAGMLGMTMTAAREWGRYNIRTNSICFGLVETPMTEVVRGEKFRDGMLAQIPLGRWSTPGEVVKSVCFLLSDGSSYITGQHLGVNGGFHISL